MRLTVEDCCQSLGFEPGQELEASLKQELENFIAEDTQTQLRDANINQRSELHKLAVQEFLDQHGSHFWPDTDKDHSRLLNNAPIFPRDSKLITRMISNMLAYKLRRYKPKGKPETPKGPPMKSESTGGTPSQSPVNDSDEGPQEPIDDDLEEDLEGAVTPGYAAETGSQNEAMGIQESIETDDPGVLPAAELPLSPAFRSPSRQTVTYYSPPTRTSAGGDFGPTGLTPPHGRQDLPVGQDLGVLLREASIPGELHEPNTVRGHHPGALGHPRGFERPEERHLQGGRGTVAGAHVGQYREWPRGHDGRDRGVVGEVW